MSSVSDKWGSFFSQGGDYQLSDFSVRQGFAGFWINYLKIKKIIPIVNSRCIVAAYSDPGSIYFSKAIYVIQFYTKFAGYSVSHLLSPSFGSDEGSFKVNLII